MILVLFSIISINILLIILINKYINTITYIKSAIEHIYYRIEDNPRILREIKIYCENFGKKTSNLEIDINRIKCYIKALIDFQRAIITINRNILVSLNKDNNNKDKNNKDINDKNKKVNKYIEDAEYLKDISNNICLMKDSLLSLGNYI